MLSYPRFYLLRIRRHDGTLVVIQITAPALSLVNPQHRMVAAFKLDCIGLECDAVALANLKTVVAVDDNVSATPLI